MGGGRKLKETPKDYNLLQRNIGGGIAELREPPSLPGTAG
jgi:hypothetical protein